ncbi:MAG TPA: tRNA pseudouridine(38-40) synthase TruA [Polyangiaceae bacterium]|nr:tRNA pseudouridine(38-40) synthase TruA [Polyangiaceae bacterium]
MAGAPQPSEGELTQGDDTLHSVILTVAYDGSQFSGIAPQVNANTVSAELLKAIHNMDPTVKSLRIASRTDAGVHARGQVVAFETRMNIPSRGWLNGLSSMLPPAVAVVAATQTAPGFEPSKRAVAKAYRYLILQGSIRDPFYHARAWRIFDPMSIDLMRQEAQALLGEHDFRAFRSAADIRTNTIRRIDSVALSPDPVQARLLCFDIKGNRFMYNMVRIIVGTLVDVGRGRVAPGAIGRAIASGDREDLGVTAPAEGLYLEQVVLPNDLPQWPYQ